MNDIFSKYQTIMFDLDGTLIDSASDLVCALNDTIVNILPSPVPFEGAKRLAGIGSRHLLRYAFEYHNTPYDDTLIETLVPVFMNAYEKNMLDKTTPFTGVEDLLRTLKNQGKNLLLVTNKPRRFTPKIIDFLKWSDVFDGIFCPEDVTARKPDPQHLLTALSVHNLSPQSALMVGDSITDYDAALAANIPVFIIGYYGQSHSEFPQAKYFLSSYDELS